jgi:hypothetical protein
VELNNINGGKYMKLIYVPRDFHLIINNATKTLSRIYDGEIVKLDIPEHFDLVNIIIKFEKDPVLLSSLFNYNLSKFNIVETQDNYYMSIGIYTACKIAYESKIKSEFSERLYDVIKDVIPNIFNIELLIKYFKNKVKLSTINIEYTHRFMDILDDIYISSKSYIDILMNNNDLDRESLNKLFRITARFLISLNSLLYLKSLDNIIVFNNLFNYYEKTILNETSSISPNENESKTIIHYLDNISDGDKYTEHGIKVTFSTSVKTLNNSSSKLIKTYMNTYPDIINILPITTLADVFISISLEDVSKYSEKNNIIHLLRDFLLFRNTHMEFAFKEGFQYD